MNENLPLNEKVLENNYVSQYALDNAKEKVDKWLASMSIEELNLLAKMGKEVDYSPIKNLDSFMNFVDAYAKLWSGDSTYALHKHIEQKVKDELLIRVNKEIGSLFEELIKAASK